MSEWTAPDEWKRNGAEWHGPCPVTSSGKDCCWVIPERKVIGCRHCSLNGGGLDRDQFIAHAGALGYLPAYHDHDTGRTEHMNGRQFRKGAKPKGWTRSPNGNHDYTGRALILVEGAKTADAVSALGLDAVCVPGSAGASTSVIGDLSKARSVTLWPDHDGLDQQHASYKISNRRGVALQFGSNAPVIRWIDPGKLKGAELNGCDAADIIEALRGKDWDDVAIREAIEDATVDGVPPQEYARPTQATQPDYLKRFSDIAEAPDVPPCLIPGFAFERRLTMFHAPSGAGKSHILYQGIAAALLHQQFLGEDCGTVTPMLVIGEMVEEDNRRYLQRHGVSEALMRDCWYMPSMKLSEVKDAADFVKPRLILVDTATSLARVAGLSINTDVEVRRMTDKFREIGCATVFLHHDRRLPASDKGEKKYDGMRGSDDFRAVSDLVVRRLAKINCLV